MSILNQDTDQITSVVQENQLKKQFVKKLSYVYAEVCDKKLTCQTEQGLSVYVVYTMRFILTMNNMARSIDYFAIPYEYAMDRKKAEHIITEFLWETWNSWLKDQPRGTTYEIDDIHKITAEYLSISVVSHRDATNYGMCKRLLEK